MEQTEKVMAKIEALLRKAESTNFGPESEALIVKAHELMAKHSIEEAMLHKASGVRDEVVVTSIPVKRSGLATQERHVLLSQVAKWQRCQAIIDGEYMSVVGYKGDTDFVKTLYESLVLQMMTSMLEADGFDNSARFAVSFGRGFVNTVAARMEEVYRRVESEVAEPGSSTALVLRDRSAAVSEKVNEIYPNLRTTKKRSVSLHGGAYEAGKSAGKNADVGVTKIGRERKELR